METEGLVPQPPPKGVPGSHQEALSTLQKWKHLDTVFGLFGCNFQQEALAHGTIHHVVLASCGLQ